MALDGWTVTFGTAMRGLHWCRNCSGGSMNRCPELLGPKWGHKKILGKKIITNKCMVPICLNTV